MKNKRIQRILVFYLIAVVVSNIFRFDLLNLKTLIESLPKWTMLIHSPLQSIGVFIGALIALKLLSKESQQEFSMFGTSKILSVIVMLSVLILLTLLGVGNNNGLNSHYYGLISAISTFIYCVFEEIGWRGYLEQELSKLREIKRVFLIAGMWYFWHLSFLRDPSLIQNVVFFLWLLLGSWGLSKVIWRSKSIIMAASFHMLINVLLFNGFVKDGLDNTNKIILFAVLIPLWTIILIRWNKNVRKLKI